MLTPMMTPGDDPKKAVLAMIARLYDEIETDISTVVECSVDMDRQEVRRAGSRYVDYISGGSQTVTLVIQRRV